ncbi:MAG: hypothetical protein HBSAPP03_13120 [Phycisphaerae bacterium]|nr:MAG: hypothetical protein HBSAPP03_13120 [Phycisphaerae bacterium]
MLRTVHVHTWSRHAAAWSSSRPSWIARVAARLILMVAVLLAVVLFVPLVVLALVVGAAWLVGRGLARAFSAAQRPNGPLDGRRNVRVVAPRPDSPEA